MIDETGPFAGALECMPDYILTTLAKRQQITYLPKIDLMCLIRAFYLMLHKPQDLHRIPFLTTPSLATNRLALWSSNGKSELWDKILKEAEQLNYDNLIKELEKLV